MQTADPAISVSQWLSKDFIRFEITNKSSVHQRCEWTAHAADVLHFFSCPAPFDIKPSETREVIFKKCVDIQAQSKEAHTYEVTFTLMANSKIVYVDKLVCHTFDQLDSNLYLTSFLNKNDVPCVPNHYSNK